MKKTEFTWATHRHFSGTASKVLRADWFNLSEMKSFVVLQNQTSCVSSKTIACCCAKNEVVFLP